MPSGARLEALVREFDRALNRLERDAIQRLDGALRLAAQRLEAELRRSYILALDDAALTQSVLMREARARILLEQVRAGLDLTTGSQANSVFSQLLVESFDLGARNALDMLGAYQTQVVSLSSGARLTVAARATMASSRLSHHGADLALKVEQLVIDGIVRGRGWGRTASELRRETNLTRRKAEQLVRTESITASDDVRRDTYQANGVEYVQRMATMDDRVCSYCAARAGNVYRADQAPVALHPGDRCYNAPWKPEWQELGLTDDDWMRAHRLEAIERSGKEPNYGPAPFERSQGMTSAPTPFWSP